jgi:hypothetical protein
MGEREQMVASAVPSEDPASTKAGQNGVGRTRDGIEMSGLNRRLIARGVPATAFFSKRL